METAVEDLQWDIEKLRKREQKLNKHLAEALEQVSFPFISENHGFTLFNAKQFI